MNEKDRNFLKPNMQDRIWYYQGSKDSYISQYPSYSYFLDKDFAFDSSKYYDQRVLTEWCTRMPFWEWLKCISYTAMNYNAYILYTAIAYMYVFWLGKLILILQPYTTHCDKKFLWKEGKFPKLWFYKYPNANLTFSEGSQISTSPARVKFWFIYLSIHPSIYQPIHPSSYLLIYTISVWVWYVLM